MGAWRVGNHYQIHVYDGNRSVATFHLAADARRAVEAVNREAWQPIKTAPKDGTVVMVFDPKTQAGIHSAAFISLDEYEQEWFVGGEWTEFIVLDPTHWKPLPLRPNGDHP